MLLNDLENQGNSCYSKPSVMQLLLTSIHRVTRKIFTHFNDDVFKIIFAYPKDPLNSQNINSLQVQRKVNSTNKELSIPLMHLNYHISTRDCICLPICSDQNKKLEVFFHGTTHKNGLDIVRNGINFRKCSSDGDFSSALSKAFYVTESFEYAKNFGRQRNSHEYAIIVFKIPKNDFAGYKNDALDLNSCGDEAWLQVIEYFDKSIKLKSGDRTDLENRFSLLSRTYIKGYINAKNKGNHNTPDVTTIQLAIKSTELAELFSRAENMSILLFKVS